MYAQDERWGAVVLPLLVLVGQKEVLHLLPAEVKLVVIVALHSLGIFHRVIQGQQELLEALHHWARGAHVHLMDIAQPEEQNKGIKAQRVED